MAALASRWISWLLPPAFFRPRSSLRPEGNPRDPVSNRVFQIFLEPMLRARDGLFDSDDPRVDRGPEIACEPRLQRPDALLERSQVFSEGCRRMLQKDQSAESNPLVAPSRAPAPRLKGRVAKRSSGIAAPAGRTTYLGKFSRIISNTSPV